MPSFSVRSARRAPSERLVTLPSKISSSARVAAKITFGRSASTKNVWTNCSTGTVSAVPSPIVGRISIRGPSTVRPNVSSETVHTRPSKSLKVWPRQKAGSGARTRITTSSPRSPRTAVSSVFEKPGYPPTCPSAPRVEAPSVDGAPSGPASAPGSSITLLRRTVPGGRDWPARRGSGPTLPA